MKTRLSLALLAAFFLAPIAMAAPTISSFSPTAAAATDPQIEILGTGFAVGATVFFGTYQSPNVFVSSSTRLLVSVPASAPIGTNVPIKVTVNGSSFTTVSTFTVIGSGPYVSGFIPTSGDVGTLVVISGAHFVNGNQPITVRFNGIVAPLFNSQSDTLLSYYAPAGVTTGPISVTRTGTGGGSWTNAQLFYVTPAVTNFSPTFGRAGTNVVIRGRNFNGATAVYFGNVSALSFTVNSNNQVTATVPPNAATGPIHVETPANGYVATTSNFVVQPSIISFSPNVGRLGTNVTIFGENLLGATNVLFGGVKAAPTGVTYSQLNVAVPNGATNGFITVMTTNGSFTSSQLFYLPPSITSFAPSNSAAFTTVQITGNNFLGATAVTFNGTPAVSFNVTNNTTIGAVVPTGVFTGPISVTTPFGTVSSGTNLLFYAAPVIISFQPMSGLPGTNVIISGTNFLGTSAVQFNGANAASFTVLPDGTLSAVVPTNASTGPISVTGSGGTTTSANPFVLNYNSDLSVTVTAPDSALLANNYTYVIVVTNRGSSTAPNVVLTNTLPGSVTLQSASTSTGSLVLSGNPIIGNLGNIISGGSATVNLTVNPLVTGLIMDTASVASDYADPISTNNTSSISTTIYLVPLLEIHGPSNNAVAISWSVALSDYFLQASHNLTDTNSWSNVLITPEFIGNQKVVTEPIGPGVKFYRLKR